MQELSNEREIVTRLRVEKNEEVARADFRKAEADKLQLEVNASTRLIGEIQNQHKTNEQKWNEERDKLLADLQQREKEIQRMRCVYFIPFCSTAHKEVSELRWWY